MYMGVEVSARRQSASHVASSAHARQQLRVAPAHRGAHSVGHGSSGKYPQSGSSSGLPASISSSWPASSSDGTKPASAEDAVWPASGSMASTSHAAASPAIVFASMQRNP